MIGNARNHNVRTAVKTTAAAAAVVLLLAFILALPASAQRFTLGESQLAGVRLSNSPKTLLGMPSYGPPEAVIASGGVFNTRGLSQMQVGGPPAWAQAVWVDGLSSNQVVWMYNRFPVAVAFVISGDGHEAEITDVVVSIWKEMSASNWAVTKKGIKIGDTFVKVLQKYGFPETLVVFQGGSTASAAAAPGALPSATRASLAGTGPRLRFGMARGRRAERLEEEEEEATRAATMARVAPAPGTRGGPLPPAAPAAAAIQEWGGHFSGVAMGQQLNLSRHMVVGYPREGIDFYLYDMKVVRIHSYTVSAGVGPTGLVGTPAVAVTPTAGRPVAIVPGGVSAARRAMGVSPGRLPSISLRWSGERERSSTGRASSGQLRIRSGRGRDRDEED